MLAISLSRISIVTTCYTVDSPRDISNDQLNYYLNPTR